MQEDDVPGRHSPEFAAATLLAWLREQRACADDAPTPLEALAARLGLATETFDPALYPGALGFLEPGEDLIFIRANLAEPVRRFTLAHELGHVALHRREGRAAEIANRGAAPWVDDAE
ncbi:MAG TPA: ImmA/IrrE family metallo-endopeptidase, partial [Ktedonobacterales bacterium]